MSHPVGERLHCDECGAEIVYVVACECPQDEKHKQHQDICCGKQMRSLGVRDQPQTEPAQPQAG